MKRLCLRDLMNATGGRLRGVDCAETLFERICIDSREIRSGDVFWALKGERQDGHDFVQQAFDRNACLSVISAPRAETIAGPILIVDETLAALGRLAKWHRNQLDTLVIGVTGSVGKTTTREMIYAALSSQHHGIRSRKNYNNEIGLPLTLLELDAPHEFAVIEMGASQISDIRTLCDMAHPEIGVITAIGPAHLSSFGSLAAIVEAKGELLEMLPSTGFAVLPGDEEITRQMARRSPCPIIFVGENANNQILARHVEVHAGNLRFHCEGSVFNVPVTGRQALSSALCAIAIGLEIGIPTHALAGGLAKFIPEPGRCNLLNIGPWTVIDDSYNASPLAVTSACQLLSELRLPRVGQRVLILGDMRELGDAATLEHERVGQLVASLRLDRLLVCGQHADDVARGAKRSGMKPHQIVAARDSETLIAILDCWLEPGDMLLVKGSRAMRMESVIDWLKQRAAIEDGRPGTGPIRICA